MIKTGSKLESSSNKPSNRISGRFVLVWWILLLSLPALFLILQSVELQDGTLVYLGLWAVIVVGFFVFTRRWSFSAILGRQFDVLEIPVYLGLTSMFLIQAFGVAPYFDKKYLFVLSSVTTLPLGLLLTGAGLFSMLFGYAMVSRSYKPDPDRQWNSFYATPSLLLTIIVYVGVLILRLGMISLGGGEMILSSKVRIGGDWYQWLVYLAELRWFFIALVTLQVAAGRWPRRFFILVLAIESTMAVISGWSSSFPLIGLLVFGCLMYAGQKIPWRRLLPVGVIVIAMIIFSIPIVRDLRSARRESGQVTLSNINASISATWGQGVDNGLKLFSDLLVIRQTATAQTPSILMSLIPGTIPYLPVQELLVAPITFIPRIIWPSKPAYIDVGSWLTIQVFGGQAEGGASAVTLAGNAYMYGGWPVVIIGMLILGVLAGLLYSWLVLPGLLHDQVGLLAVYAAVIVANFHLGESDFVSLWQGLVQRTIVFLLVARILCLKKHDVSTPLQNQAVVEPTSASKS